MRRLLYCMLLTCSPVAQQLSPFVHDDDVIMCSSCGKGRLPMMHLVSGCSSNIIRGFPVAAQHICHQIPAIICAKVKRFPFTPPYAFYD